MSSPPSCPRVEPVSSGLCQIRQGRPYGPHGSQPRHRRGDPHQGVEEGAHHAGEGVQGRCPGACEGTKARQGRVPDSGRRRRRSGQVRGRSAKAPPRRPPLARRRPKTAAARRRLARPPPARRRPGRPRGGSGRPAGPTEGPAATTPARMSEPAEPLAARPLTDPHPDRLSPDHPDYAAIVARPLRGAAVRRRHLRRSSERPHRAHRGIFGTSRFLL